MQTPLKILITTAIFFTFAVNPVGATQIWLEPNFQFFNIGDSLTFDLYADIDPENAIMGFGYDLSFDNGSTFISGPGDSGSSLTFVSFTPNSALGFYYDPLYDSDSDTISGFLDLFDPDVSGTGLILGTFEFIAFASITESIFLSADDVGANDSVEGLVPGFTADNEISILPNAATATASPVPEPATILMVMSGMAGLGIFGRKRFRK